MNPPKCLKNRPEDVPPRANVYGMRTTRIIKAVAQVVLPRGNTFPGAGHVTLVRLNRMLTEAGPLIRFGYRWLLWWIEMASVFRTTRRFSRLSSKKQDDMLKRWLSGKGLSWLAVLIVSSLLKFAHFDDPDIVESVGSVYDKSAKTAEIPRYMSQVLSEEDVSPGEDVECDAVVVGTGAGGAVVAKELAEAGLAVVMLEEGEYKTRIDFSGRAWDAKTNFYRRKGMTFAFGNVVIPLLMGQLVGGSTAVNVGTCWRTPSWILEKWHRELKLSDLSPSKMERHFNRVEDILQVETAKDIYIGDLRNLLAEGCNKLGWSHRPLKRNAPGCEGQGVCAFGCPTDARRSMNISYIPLALKRAAVLYTGVRAQRIWIEGNRAVGIIAETTKERKPFRVRSRAVVLACGAIMTPFLLRRQGLCNKSGQLGRNLSIHPATGVSGLFDKKVRTQASIPQGYCVDEFLKEGLLFEGGSLPLDIMSVMLPFTGRRLMNLMEHHDRIAVIGGVIEDRGRGRVRVGPGGQPLISYWIGNEELKKIKRSVEISTEILFSAGAKAVFPLVHGFEELEVESDLESFRSATQLRPRDIFLCAFHPMGTCRMGSDPLHSVVNADHEAHDLPGLYICDGSSLPSSIAVNPQLTIMALATRAAEKLAKKLS